MAVPPQPPLPPPGPPPPPPISSPSTESPSFTPEAAEAASAILHKAATLLETNRCLETEHEAALRFAATVLSYPAGLPHDNTSATANGTNSAGSAPGISGVIPAGVKDAWLAMLQNSSLTEEVPSSASKSSAEADVEQYEYPLRKGQLSRAIQTTSLATALHHASEVAQKLTDKQRQDSESCVDALKLVVNHSESNTGRNGGNEMMTPKWFFNAFDEKVKEIREYHARHPVAPTGGIGNGVDAEMGKAGTYSGNQMTVETDKMSAPEGTSNNLIFQSAKKRKMGNPNADGYDLYSVLHEPLSKIKSGQTFSEEEVVGKYLDLHASHDAFRNFMLAVQHKRGGTVAGTSSEDAVSKISYTDFCTFLASGLNSTTEMQTTTTLQIKDKDKHTDDGKGNGGEHDTDKDNSNVKSNTKKTGTLTVTEKDKLSQRKKYIRFLTTLNDYLRNFLGRISPLLDMEGGVIRPCLQEFEDEWSKYGGISGEGGDLGTGASWEFIPSDRFLAVVGSNKLGGNEPNRSNANENAAEPSSTSLDLKQFASVEELMERTTPDALKVELSRLGMKCGGRPLDRAKRLWLARDTPLEDLPKKIFTKGNPKKMKEEDSNGNAVDSNTVDSLGSNQRRIDIARMETIAHALLNQLRPALDATSRRSERRLTQTLNEKEREMEEEINGTYDDGNAAKQGRGDNENGDDQSDDSDDEDAPIYNPKGVPLGWDGKPIPYWLFKLHGLNHFYKCEICGNVSYRGRHNFEKHFAEAKHSYGMKCLGIPNTKHFHGVTKIEDAQNLWRKLQADMNKDIFDASKEEEYEDSNGNVLSRATYEDLARQGLL